jgi:hypothetical protein
MDLGELKGLALIQGRQQAGQTAGQQGFATTRWADHQQVVAPTGGNLKGAAAMQLPFNLA